MAFDLAGIAVSAGSACSSGRIEASHVVKAMGYCDIAATAIRISGGWKTTEQDVQKATTEWKKLYDRVGAKPSPQCANG
jgi:cysteine desulfurase